MTDKPDTRTALERRIDQGHRVHDRLDAEILHKLNPIFPRPDLYAGISHERITKQPLDDEFNPIFPDDPHFDRRGEFLRQGDERIYPGESRSVTCRALSRSIPSSGADCAVDRLRSRPAPEWRTTRAGMGMNEIVMHFRRCTACNGMGDLNGVCPVCDGDGEVQVP